MLAEERRLHGAQVVAADDNGRIGATEAAVLARAYDHGASLLPAVPGALLAAVDRACAGGHLMRIAIEHRRLNRPPGSLQTAPGGCTSLRHVRSQSAWLTAKALRKACGHHSIFNGVNLSTGCRRHLCGLARQHD
jgi:hypothetical protein